MEIMKVFSSYDDYGYEEERLYSVLMSEEELSLFSEIQREFAFKDYEGLSEAQAKALKAKRSEYAKELLKSHRQTQKGITEAANRYGENLGSISTESTIKGGGVKSNFTTETIRGSKDSAASAIKLHRGEVIKGHLDQSGNAKKIMREAVEKEVSSGGPKWKRPVKELTLQQVAEKATPTKKIKKLGFLSRNKKALAIGGVSAAALAGLGYGAKKLHDKKKKEN